MGFEPDYGKAVPVGEGGGGPIVRVTAHNPGPFTGAGTNSYVLGDREVMIVDPGPADPSHIEALLAAVRGRVVSHILITHTHRDHVDGLALLQRHIDAPTVAEGPHREARALKPSETNPFLSSADMAFVPDIAVGDGAVVRNESVEVEVIATPGHTANHVVFSLGATCLSGDHVMGWSTTVIAPPDGAMAPYLASLDRLLKTPHTRYLPGHGGAIDDPHKAVTAMRSHRLMRERAILERLYRGDTTIEEVVAALYGGLDPRLVFAAGLSVLAHLEKLEEEGVISLSGLGRETRPALNRPEPMPS